MFIVLRPKYTVEVTIQEPPRLNSAGSGCGLSVDANGQAVVPSGLPPFWDGIKARNSTGCDQVLEHVKKALAEAGLAGSGVRLVRYEEAP